MWSASKRGRRGALKLAGFTVPRLTLINPLPPCNTSKGSAGDDCAVPLHVSGVPSQQRALQPPVTVCWLAPRTCLMLGLLRAIKHACVAASPNPPKTCSGATAAILTTRSLTEGIHSRADLVGKAVGTWTDYVDKLKADGIPTVGYAW